MNDLFQTRCARRTRSSLATRRHRAASPIRLTLTAVGVIGAVSLSLASTAGASKAHGVSRATSSAVKPDYAFYRGKTITFIVPNVVGSFADQIFRALEPSMEATLGATFVEHYIAPPSIIGADTIAHSVPDGLTVGVQSMSTAMYDIYTNTAPESFSLQKVHYFETNYLPPVIFIACSGSPITSMAQLIKDKSQLSVLDYISGSDEVLHPLLKAYGVPVHYITGYNGTTLNAGCQRGDGAITANYANNVVNSSLTGLPPGETMLMAMSKYPPKSALNWINSAAPLLSTFEKQFPPKTAAEKQALVIATALSKGLGQSFFTPAGVSPGKVLALKEAVQKAWYTPAVSAALLLSGYSTKYVDPAVVIPSIKYSVKHINAIRNFLTS